MCIRDSPIGTPVSLLLDACGGVKDGTYKLIAGGPMMGMAQYTADIPVAKGTGAILAFCEKEEQTVEPVSYTHLDVYKRQLIYL